MRGPALAPFSLRVAIVPAFSRQMDDRICVIFNQSDDDQEGVMDNLLEALKTGSAFAVNRERKGERRRTPRAAGGTNVS